MTQNNRLDHEKSPYLRQHKDNPIWWQAWGEEAFAQARHEDKPIFLSVGYATCHWCHVMEGDSFEKQDVADIVNAGFIAIKVDREERPDVDALYMAAVQAMSQRGGWPMTLVLTPEGQPFFAGTFIPREPLKGLLQRIRALWQSPSRAQILQTGAQVQAHLQSLAAPARLGAEAVNSKKLFNEAAGDFFRSLQANFDAQNGGFGGAPKFPPAMTLLTLLRYYQRSQQASALNLVTETLDAMLRGGLCDQLAGGFHRYATDEAWLVPHFEKMLYDNALLAWVYCEAFQLTGKREYEFALRHTLDYVLRDLQASQGGFYAGEDADSEKTEGKFYVWAYDEVKALLSPQELAVIERVYGLSPQGNFDTSEHSEHELAAGMKGLSHMNILCLGRHEQLPDRNEPLLKAALAKLFERRSTRPRPFLDAQILCGWNGLMIGALALAARTLQDEQYLAAAQKAARFICSEMLDENRDFLWRQYVDGQARIPAHLEDYAFFIFACIELYQSDFDEGWLKIAVSLQKRQDALFWDKAEGCYFDSDGKDPCLLLRVKSFYDYATPSGNSLAAFNLLRLAAYGFDWQENREKAESIFSTVGTKLSDQVTAFPLLLVALDFYLDASKEIAILGPITATQVQGVLRLLRQTYLPNKVVALRDLGEVGELAEENAFVPLLRGRVLLEGQPTFYVCTEQVCALPSLDPEQALRALRP